MKLLPIAAWMMVILPSCLKAQDVTSELMKLRGAIDRERIERAPIYQPSAFQPQAEQTRNEQYGETDAANSLAIEKIHQLNDQLIADKVSPLVILGYLAPVYDNYPDSIDYQGMIKRALLTQKDEFYQNVLNRVGVGFSEQANTLCKGKCVWEMISALSASKLSGGTEPSARYFIQAVYDKLSELKLNPQSSSLSFGSTIYNDYTGFCSAVMHR